MSDEMRQRLIERDAELARERAKLEAKEERSMAALTHVSKSIVSVSEAFCDAEVLLMRLRGGNGLTDEEKERLRKADEESKAERKAREEEARKKAQEDARQLAADRSRLRDRESVFALDRCPPAIKALVVSDDWDASVMPVRSARAWASDDVRGLVLRGGVGTGKSVAAACAMAQDCQNQSHGLRGQYSWHRPNDFASGMLHSYDDKAPKIGTRMVVIDDIGRETKADFEEALVVLIDDHLTRFVLTTNLTVEELEKRYGERLVDRLHHECLFVSVAGNSKRRRGQ